MTHHRPKSPSPAQLKPVGDTVVGLEPVPDAEKSLAVPPPPADATTPEQPKPGREITAPMEIPQQFRAPSLNATTPSTPLALAAPNLAKVVHAEMHKSVAPTELSSPAEAPALGSVPPLTTPIDPALALGPTFEPLPASEPVKKRESGPRKSHPEMPAARKSRPDAAAISDVPTGPPRKSLSELPAAVPTGKKATHDALPATAPPSRSKSKLEVPAAAAPATDLSSQTMSERPPIDEVSTGPIPALPAPVVRKSRTDMPRGKGPGSGERPQVKREGVITAPLPSPEPEIALGGDVEPLPTPKMMPVPDDLLHQPTSPRTLPQIPPVLPFGGIEDPRFKRGAMVIGIVFALVMMAMVSWELLKHEPSMPPDEALKPAFVELPAPPRKDDDETPHLATPPKPLQLEITTDAGTKLVAAGTLNVWCDPDANVVVDGKDLGPTPAHSVMPAGKVTFALVNAKIGLHKVESVELKPGENKNVTYHFSPGFLEVVADDDAKLTVDGRPITKRTMEVWEGLHRVDAVYGHDKVSRSAEVLAGETTTVELRPQ